MPRRFADDAAARSSTLAPHGPTMNSRRFSLALLLSSAILPTSALAQPTSVSDGDKAAARQLTFDGYAALDRKDYAGAADRFARADAIFHAPTVLLGLARARVGLGKLLSAQEIYNRLIREPLAPGASETFVRAVDEGRRELAALEPRIPALIVQVRGADRAKVTLDGAELPVAVIGIKRPVDPGNHVGRAEATGLAPAEASGTVAEGKVETVTLSPVAAPPGAPEADGPASNAVGADAGSSGDSARKPVGIALLGVGAAGLVVGAITAGLTASKRSGLLHQCPTGHCLPSQQPALGGDVNTLHMLAATSTGTFVAGGVVGVAGVILVATVPKAKASAAGLLPLVGPGFVGLEGSF
jgi:hypothetical protein